MEHIKFKIPITLYKKLQKISIKNGMNVTNLVNLLINTKLEELFKHGNKSVENLDKCQRVYIHHVVRLGWPFITRRMHSNEIMRHRCSLSKKELDKDMIKEFSQSDNFNNLFNGLIKNLDNNHANQIKLLKDLLCKNHKYYQLLFEYLFSLIEYIFIYRKGYIKNNNTLPNKVLNSEAISEKIPQNYNIYNYMDVWNWTTLVLLSKLEKSLRFNKFTYNEVPYNRNTVIHGRINPSKLTYVNFVKLLVLARDLLINPYITNKSAHSYIN